MQERRNSSALAMELRLSCTNPSMYRWRTYKITSSGLESFMHQLTWKRFILMKFSSLVTPEVVFWQLLVQQIMNISSKWHFCYSAGCTWNWHIMLCLQQCVMLLNVAAFSLYPWGMYSWYITIRIECSRQNISQWAGQNKILIPWWNT